MSFVYIKLQTSKELLLPLKMKSDREGQFLARSFIASAEQMSCHFQRRNSRNYRDLVCIFVVISYTDRYIRTDILCISQKNKICQKKGKICNSSAENCNWTNYDGIEFILNIFSICIVLMSRRLYKISWWYN